MKILILVKIWFPKIFIFTIQLINLLKTVFFLEFKICISLKYNLSKFGNFYWIFQQNGIHSFNLMLIKSLMNRKQFSLLWKLMMLSQYNLNYFVSYFFLFISSKSIKINLCLGKIFFKQIFLELMSNIYSFLSWTHYFNNINSDYFSYK
jgi:hypothetical protein